MVAASSSRDIVVADYDLAATLTSGQAFRWRWEDNSWTGVIGNHWVRLRQNASLIKAETGEPIVEWAWLTQYLQTSMDLPTVHNAFPADEPMRAAVAACRGLRLLKQAPWECLASFILSSTKQIVQIQEIISTLCQRFGEPLAVAPGATPAFSFPSPARLDSVSESELRACKMGFRAPYLRTAAQAVAAGTIDLERLSRLPVDSSRKELMTLPGVGPKIADCVLLFAYGFQSAFPMDVWVLKALRQLYFPRRRPTLSRMRQFATAHFGPYAGYAQQYLFHYMRTKFPRPTRRRVRASR